MHASDTHTAPISTTRSPSPQTIEPVPIPTGCYPIELVQFLRDDSPPLHWALFVRTAMPRACSATGNFYELVGGPDTYTSQILHSVTFLPDLVPDWRGTHVVGWVRPAALPAFERVVKRVRVWRHRADWRSQHWVYEVMCGCGRDRPEGVFVDVGGVSFGGLQKHMGRLLDAWEKGDI